jgi:hypothetical protein
VHLFLTSILQLEFPAKPKGELQKSNDEKFMKFLKTQGKGIDME